MARKAKPPNAWTVEALRHRREEATRKNIPTAEYLSVLEKAAQDPVRVAYDRRNRDLDPQLPLYIQEKVHPKALIDDLLRQTRRAAVDPPTDDGRASEHGPSLLAGTRRRLGSGLLRSS